MGAIKYIFPGLLLSLVFMSVHARAQAPICFAAPEGSDLNDGTYWAFAKADVMACYDELPPGGGTVFVRDGGSNRRAVPACKSTDPSGCGIWIMGSSDPNYSSPPAGWRKAKSGGVRIVGVGGTNTPSFSSGGRVAIAAGNNSDTSHPAIWLSGYNSLTMDNLVFNFPCAGMYLGIDSTGSRTNRNTASWNLDFNNFSIGLSMVPGCGPAIDVGPGSDWIFINHSQLGGNNAEGVAVSSYSRVSGTTTATTASALPSSWSGTRRLGIVGASNPSFNGGNISATVTGSNTFTYAQRGLANGTATGGYVSSDQAQVVVLEPTTGTATANNYIQNSYFAYGGVRAYSGSTQRVEIFIDNILQEGGFAPILDFASCPAGGGVNGSARNLEVADNIASYAAVRSACTGIYNSLQVQNVGTVDGAATLLGGAVPSNYTQDPLLTGQLGIANGRLYGQTDAARRGFGPVATRFTNTAILNGYGLTFGSATAPDGTNNATSITKTGSGTGYYNLEGGNIPFAPNQIIIWGVWVQSRNPPGFAASTEGCPMGLSISNLSYTLAWTTTITGSRYQNNGEWMWCWGAAKLATVTGTGGPVTVAGGVTSSQGVNLYGPTVLQIPAGTLTDNEAIEYAINLQSYRADAVPGQVSLLPGEQFKADSIQLGAGPTITSGLGSPVGSASPGSIYLRRDGAPGSTFYIYEKGTWKAEF